MAGRGDELKLIGIFPSPFVQRVKLALSFKGLSYENVEEEDENLRNKSDLLLRSNPVHKKVPVLIHNGNAICESMIIVQYIDEVFAGAGPSLLPADPYERAVARFWAAYIDDKLLSSWMMDLRGRTEEAKAEGRKVFAAVAQNLEGALRDMSKGKPFFGGDSVGLVDIALGGFAAWVYATEKIYGINKFDAAKTPLLAAWVERFCALDAAKAALPDVDDLVEYGKRRHALADAEAAAAAAQGN